MNELTDYEMMLLDGIIAGIFILIILFNYVLSVIAYWKIFEKAGEKGWKALIPIYNAYILCKITNVKFWIWMVAIPFAISTIVGGMATSPDKAQIMSTVITLYELSILILLGIKLGKAFHKNDSFIVGLVLLPTIFYLVLGLDQSKYIGFKKKG